MNKDNDHTRMPKTKQLVKPSLGIHYGMSEVAYHKLDACNASTLGNLKDSNERMAMFKRSTEEEDTIPRRVGRAVHLRIESQEKFNQTYRRPDECAQPGCARFGNKYDERGQWWCGYHGKKVPPVLDGATILPVLEYDMVVAMSRNIEEHPKVGALIKATPQKMKEVVLVWESQVYPKLLHNSRIDLLCGEKKMVIDLKTSRDVSPARFKNDALKFNYWIQAALYMRGVEALFPGEFKHYMIVSVEKTPPFQVAAYVLDPSWIGMIQEQLEKEGGYIDRYSQAVSTNQWPGYDDLMDLEPPAYFQNI